MVADNVPDDKLRKLATALGVSIDEGSLMFKGAGDRILTKFSLEVLEECGNDIEAAVVIIRQALEAPRRGVHVSPLHGL
jgi:hypothetical protein